MTPLVLVHGFMGGSDQWHLQTPLTRTGPLVCPDLPGFGLHGDHPPRRSIHDYAAWVLAELDRLHIADFRLLGHSMGGMIAQEVAHRAPDRITRLMLYGTGCVGALPGRFESIATSRKRARADGAEKTARRIAATWFLNGAAAGEYPRTADIAACAGPDAIAAGLDAMQNWNGQENLSRITVPTLILWGDGDRTYSWAETEKLWRGIANSALAVIPGCAHAVHLEKPEIFNAIVADFVGA